MSEFRFRVLFTQGEEEATLLFKDSLLTEFSLFFCSLDCLRTPLVVDIELTATVVDCRPFNIPSGARHNLKLASDSRGVFRFKISIPSRGFEPT